MIARIWHGVTEAGKADGFFQFVRQTGEKDYLKAPGNRGVYILKHQSEKRAEFLLISLWDSLASIRRFAGKEYHKAVYPYPEESRYLVELEPEVKHFDVLAKTLVGENAPDEEAAPFRMSPFSIY